jgi:hypothetical protein
MKFLTLTSLALAFSPAAFAALEAKCMIVENPSKTGYDVKEIIYPYDFHGYSDLLKKQWKDCAASMGPWKQKIHACDDHNAELVKEEQKVRFIVQTEKYYLGSEC